MDPRSQPDNYTTHAGQQSSNVVLQAGQRYYVETLHKEANLIDHLSVRWRLPSGAMEEPIPGSRLVYEMAPRLALSLTNVTVEEGRPAVWDTATVNFLPQSFRWQRDGADVPGATNKSYTLAAAALGDDGARFQAFITNRFGATNTTEARLTVLRDTNAPTIAGVLSLSRSNVFVIFSEPVEAASALNPRNYDIVGVSLQGAAFGDDGRTVILTTAPLNYESTYTVAASNVRDHASAPNTLAPVQVSFTARAFNPRDVGGPGLAGSVAPVAGGADIRGSGSDIGGPTDQFQFGCQTQTGDFDFKVRVRALDFTDLWTKGGFMARESLQADSRFAAALATPSLAGSFFQYRAETGRLATNTGSFPVVLSRYLAAAPARGRWLHRFRRPGW